MMDMKHARTLSAHRQGESGSGGTSAFRLAFAPVFGFQAMKRREFANGLRPILEGERATHEAEIEYP